MNPEKMQSLINSIGIMAETSFIFYKTCLQSGASEKEAMAMTEVFLSVTIDQVKKAIEEGEADHE